MAVNWESIKKAAAFHVAAEKKTEEEKKAQRLRFFLNQYPSRQYPQALNQQSQLSNMYGAIGGLGFLAAGGVVTSSGFTTASGPPSSMSVLPGTLTWVPPGPYYPQGIVEETCPVQKSAIEQFKLAEPRQAFKQAKVPDSINMIVGWRTWRVKRDHVAGEWRLQAIGQETTWEPKKKMEAKCVFGGASIVDPGGDSCHAAPQRNCSCGFWAFKTVDMLPEALIGQSHRSEAIVIGSVDLWGRVIETENGFRAEYAYPKELWLLEDWLEELGWIYGVPIRTRALTTKDTK